MIRKFILAIAIVYILSTVMLGQRDRKTDTFTGVTEIKLQTVSGNCVVQRSSSAAVSVEVDSSFSPDSYEAEIEQRGSVLILEERFHGRNNSGSSQWTLMVPDDVTFEFDTASGDFEMSGLRADIEVRTASGDIRLTDVSGNLQASSASGDVVAEGASGFLHLTSASGDVEVYDSVGEFNASSASGDVRARNLSFEAESSFSSASGNTHLSLASSPEFDLRVSSASGDASLELNGANIRASIEVQARKDRNIRAPFAFDHEEKVSRWNQEYVLKTVNLGGGGPLIELSSASGRAEIQR